MLRPGGRIAVISLPLAGGPDRQALLPRGGALHVPPDFPVCVCGHEPVLRVLTPRPVPERPRGGAQPARRLRAAAGRGEGRVDGGCCATSAAREAVAAPRVRVRTRPDQPRDDAGLVRPSPHAHSRRGNGLRPALVAHTAAIYSVFSAARRRAEAARGLSAIFARGRAHGRGVSTRSTGSRPQAQIGKSCGHIQPRASSRKKCLTIRSSSEWNADHREPAARSRASSPPPAGRTPGRPARR